MINTSTDLKALARAIAKEINRLDKQIRWIKMVMYFLLGVVTYMMVFYKER